MLSGRLLGWVQQGRARSAELARVLPNARHASVSAPERRGGDKNTDELIALLRHYVRDIDDLTLGSKRPRPIAQVIAHAYHDGVRSPAAVTSTSRGNDDERREQEYLLVLQLRSIIASVFPVPAQRAASAEVIEYSKQAGAVTNTPKAANDITVLGENTSRKLVTHLVHGFMRGGDHAAKVIGDLNGVVQGVVPVLSSGDDDARSARLQEMCRAGDTMGALVLFDEMVEQASVASSTVSHPSASDCLALLHTLACAPRDAPFLSHAAFDQQGSDAVQFLDHLEAHHAQRVFRQLVHGCRERDTAEVHIVTAMTTALEYLAKCCTKSVADALTSRGTHHLVRSRAQVALSILSDAVKQANELQPVVPLPPAKLLRELLRLHGLAGDAMGLEQVWEKVMRQGAQEQDHAESRWVDVDTSLDLRAAHIVALTDCAQAYARDASLRPESAVQSLTEARALLQRATRALDELRAVDDGQFAAMAVHSIASAALFQPGEEVANDLKGPLDMETALRVVEKAVQRCEVGALLCNTLLKACFHLPQEHILALLDVLPQPNAAALSAVLAEAEAKDQIKIDRAVEKSSADYPDVGEDAGQWEHARRTWEQRDSAAARLVAALTTLTHDGETYSADPVTMSTSALNWLLQLRLKSSPRGCAAMRVNQRLSSIVDFWGASNLLPPVLPNGRTLGILMQAYAFDKNGSGAVEAVDHMRDRWKVYVSDSSAAVTQLVLAVAASPPRIAIPLYRSHIKPLWMGLTEGRFSADHTPRQQRALLNAFILNAAACRDVGRAWRTFKFLSDTATAASTAPAGGAEFVRPLQPDTRVYSALTHAVACAAFDFDYKPIHFRCDDPGTAIQYIRDRARSDGVALDGRCYFNILRAYYSAARHAVGELHIRQTRGASKSATDQPGLKQSREMESGRSKQQGTVDDDAIKEKILEEVLALLDDGECEQQLPAPGRKHYALVISICAKLGFADEADAVAARMVAAGIDLPREARNRIMTARFEEGLAARIAADDELALHGHAGASSDGHDSAGGSVAPQYPGADEFGDLVAAAYMPFEDAFREMTNSGIAPTSLDVDRMVRVRLQSNDSTSLNNELSFIHNCFNMYGVAPGDATMLEIFDACVQLADLVTAKRALHLMRQCGVEARVVEQLQAEHRLSLAEEEH